MPNYSGFLIGRVMSQSAVAVQDQTMHQLGLSEIRGTQRSTDSKWNGARRYKGVFTSPTEAEVTWEGSYQLAAAGAAGAAGR